MKNRLIYLGIGAVLLVGAILIPESMTLVRLGLFLAAFGVIGWRVIADAVKSILRGNVFNENTLMLIAAIGAFCIQEYPEAVFVMLFYTVGELFEDYAVKRSRRSISQVMNICPDYAFVLKDGVLQKVDPEDVQIGDVLVVSPGERIPLDGMVIRGSSWLDTSALTGESLPRPIGEGDTALSGCINQGGALTIQVTKVFEDSTVSRILEMVETASARKSSSEKFITRFAKYYTPIVLVCAVVLAVLPPLLLEGAAFRDYLYRALSFLVVSCPCALVISVPLTFFGGIGGAARKGILIKGGSYIEALSQAKNMVFDKTGTLTKGSFCVEKVWAVGMEQGELMMYAAYAEYVSRHPIAQSVLNAYGQQIDGNRITESEELPGYGVRAVVDGKAVLAGNEKLMQLHQISCQAAKEGTVVYVAVDGNYAGCITIADEVKADAKAGIAAIVKAGIPKICMLTGDRWEAAAPIAGSLGIDWVKSDLLPDEKVQHLEQIMSDTRGKTVYVGDGINDAPVLARADVGIAMGALGSDAAVEAADIVIMTDEITKIEQAVKISKKTMSIAKQNIIFSVAVKVGILILCSLNIVGMGVAVFGDVGVMVLAVLNSFRALKQ